MTAKRMSFVVAQRIQAKLASDNLIKHVKMEAVTISIQEHSLD
jgi:hypothetical protein